MKKRLLKDAKKYLVGGVDSPVRSFNYVGIEPLVVERGAGSKVYGTDGRRYIDYVMSWGANILGHAHPKVASDIAISAGRGLSFGATNPAEIELAKTIREAVPFIGKIRFVNSGTEAVMGAIRLARGFTGRNKILKFRNAYHGHADYLLTKGGSGLATLNIPSSEGVTRDAVKDTLIADLDDDAGVEKVFERYGKNIAAVIVEPVGGNYGVRPPDAQQLKWLRKISKRYGALLIFDEVITGFRFGFGSFAQRMNVKPDLICLGKIIGGGLPIGAYAGPDKIMKRLAPLGQVYQASTFAGNPVTMSSGLSTLRVLKKTQSGYNRIGELAKRLVIGVWREAGKRAVPVKINSYGSMFSLRFEKKDDFVLFYRVMFERGVFLAPSEFEANFISFAHTGKDIDDTIKAAAAAFERIKR
jgi:glutamate-1-semialdehyde 2,1-aminomutase